MGDKNEAESEDEGEVYELAKREGKVVVPTDRRTTIPEKPNVSLNLWNLIKNSIGKELSRIPMPVNFNEPLSMLQRLTEDLEYSSILDLAATMTDSREQLAAVAAFTVSSYASTVVRTTKPFNPLLGETFEADRMHDRGWRCITEQVSHHPPAVAQHCESAEWVLWQEFTMSCKFRGKYISVIPQGIAHLRFKRSGHHYTWRKVTTTVHNVVIGRLWLDQSGEMDIFNHKTKDNCHLKYAQYSYFSRETPRKVTGSVTDEEGNAHFLLQGTWDDHLEAAPVLEPEADERQQQTGPWKMLWEREREPGEPDDPAERGDAGIYFFSRFAVELNEEEESVAPTDSRLRPDQRLMEIGNWEESNEEKVRLEEKQRSARKKRCENDPEAADAASGSNGGDHGWTPLWFRKEEDPVTGIPIHVYANQYWKSKANQDWSRCPDIF